MTYCADRLVRRYFCSPVVLLVATALALGAACAPEAARRLGADSGEHSATATVPRAAGCGNRFVQGDFDGNGKTDYACMYYFGGGETAVLVWRGAMTGSTYQGPGFTSEVWAYWSPGNFEADRCDNRFVAGDFDGDGKTDLACMYDDGNAQARILVMPSAGFTFDSQVWTYWPAGNFEASNCDGRFFSGNFDGDADGKVDLACLYKDSSTQARMLVFRSIGSAFDSDVWYTWPSGFEVDRVAGRIARSDFDHDGATDLAYMYDYGQSSAKIEVLRANPNRTAFLSDTWISWASPNFDASRCTGRFVAGKFKGNDTTDLACMYDYGNAATSILVFSSTGSSESWISWAPGNYESSRCTNRLVAGDLNGDSKADLVCLYDETIAGGEPMSVMLGYISTGTAFDYGAVWPPLKKNDKDEVTQEYGFLNAEHCANRLFVGRSFTEAGAPDKGAYVACGVDYGSLSVGMQRFDVAPNTAATPLMPFLIDHPRHAVVDPNVAVHGFSAFAPDRDGRECRPALGTFIFNQPDLSHSSVDYRVADYWGGQYYLWPEPSIVPINAPEIVFLTELTGLTIDEANILRFPDSSLFADKFNALVDNNSDIDMVLIDEPYLYKLKDGCANNLLYKGVLERVADLAHDRNLKVWVNFSAPEVNAMQTGSELNSGRFDVVSVDVYHTRGKLAKAMSFDDVRDWFNAEVALPYLEWIHANRMDTTLGPKQHEIVIPDGLVFQPWNIDEIQNVNKLLYVYSDWVIDKNQNQSDPPVQYLSLYAWHNHSENNAAAGPGAVPFLLEYWDDYRNIPFCQEEAGSLGSPGSGAY